MFEVVTNTLLRDAQARDKVCQSLDLPDRPAYERSGESAA
jgi:hypothetical protein